MEAEDHEVLDISLGHSTNEDRLVRANSPTRTHTSQARRGWPDENLGNLKLIIPTFSGKNDPDAYLDWEKKIQLVFNCQKIFYLQKGQASCNRVWRLRSQLVGSNCPDGIGHASLKLTLCTSSKALLKKCFVPSHYSRDVNHRLGRLTQGTKSVEDYFQEMEMLMLKAAVQETSEATMARFQAGLGREL